MTIEAPDTNGRYAPNRLADLAQADASLIRFRPGPGGELTPEWAAYMLNQWWAARDKRLPFAEAVKAAALHFMVGEQDG